MLLILGVFFTNTSTTYASNSTAVVKKKTINNVEYISLNKLAATIRKGSAKKLSDKKYGTGYPFKINERTVVVYKTKMKEAKVNYIKDSSGNQTC